MINPLYRFVTPHRLAALLWIGILCAAGCGTPQTVLVTIPLEFIASDGCRTGAHSMMVLNRLPTADADGFIWIEAESALELAQWPDARVAGMTALNDPNASGGQAIEGISTARYYAHSPVARPVDVWLRLRPASNRLEDTQRPDALRHQATLNGQALPPLREPAIDEGGGSPWSWRKIGSGRLAEGENRLELVRSSRAMLESGALGSRVDVVALAPDGRRPLQLPEGVFPTIANRLGAAATQPLTVPGLVAWDRVTFDDVGAGSRQRPYLYVATGDDPSLDDWADLDQHTGYPLSHIAPRRGPLNIRVEMDVPFAPPRPTAAIRRLAVRAHVDPSTFIELKANDARLVFCGETGGLFLIENTRTGDAVNLPGRPAPLGAIAFKKPGEARWLRVDAEGDRWMTPADIERVGPWPLTEGRLEPNPTRPTIRRNGQRLEIEYRFVRPGLGEALMTLVVEPAADGAWRFAQRVEHLRGPADVVHSIFPIVPRLRLGDSGLDDTMMRPSGWFSQTMRPGRDPLPNVAYLGQVIMPWIDVSDARSGIYIGSHDASATNTVFRSVGGGDAGEAVYLETEKRQDIKPGQAMTWEYRLGLHGGDWRWGADRYRRWFTDTWGPSRIPEHVRQMDGWLAWMVTNTPRGAFHFDRLPDGLTRARAAGLDWVQVWGQFGFDWGPAGQAVYLPSPVFGGADAWARACHDIVSRGGYVGGYFTYRMFDITHLVTDSVTGFYRKTDYPPGAPLPPEALFRKAQLVDDPTGAIAPFPPPHGDIDTQRDAIAAYRAAYEANEHKPLTMPQWRRRMWLGDPDWIEHMRFWVVDQYQRQYGNNAVYLDVLGAGEPLESYDPRRNHNGDGGYSRAKLELARQVVSAARANTPRYAPSMEGLGDLPGLYCVGMSSGLFFGDTRRMLRYTLPDHVIIDGMLNEGGRTPWRSMTGAWLEGAMLSLLNEPSAIDVALLNLRRHFDGWLAGAEVRDAAGLDLSDGRVEGRVFAVSQGGYRGLIVNLRNRYGVSGVKAAIDHPAGGPLQAAFAIGLDGRARALDARRTAAGVGFDAPADAVSIVFLPQRADAIWPLLRLELSENPAVVATVLNPTGEARIGTLRLGNIELPEPYNNNPDAARAALPLAVTEQPYEVPPYGTQELRYPLTGYPANPYSVYATAEAGRDQRHVSRRVLLTPTALDGAFELVGREADNPAAGRRAQLHDVTENHRAVIVPSLWLLPNRRYRLTLSARAAQGQGQAAMKLSLSYDGRQTREADFELSLSGGAGWTQAGGEFETPERLESARLQVVAHPSWGRVEFDDVRVVDLGAVE